MKYIVKNRRRRVSSNGKKALLRSVLQLTTCTTHVLSLILTFPLHVIITFLK